jgi:hypothetical protein
MAARKKPSVYSRALHEVQQAQQEPSDNQTVNHQDSLTSRQSDVLTANQLNSKPAKPRRIKATFYLHPEDIIAIDEMQTKRFREHGKKPEKSELVSEAIQALSKQVNP